MLEKKDKSINPLKAVVVGEMRKINLTKDQRKRNMGDKKDVNDASTKWYTGRINPSHEGMIW